jgi:hypothetical protein
MSIYRWDDGYVRQTGTEENNTVVACFKALYNCLEGLSEAYQVSEACYRLGSPERMFRPSPTISVSLIWIS